MSLRIFLFVLFETVEKLFHFKFFLGGFPLAFKVGCKLKQDVGV